MDTHEDFPSVCPQMKVQNPLFNPIKVKRERRKLFFAKISISSLSMLASFVPLPCRLCLQPMVILTCIYNFGGVQHHTTCDRDAQAFL